MLAYKDFAPRQIAPAGCKGTADPNRREEGVQVWNQFIRVWYRTS
jgi:hypothetical protein